MAVSRDYDYDYTVVLEGGERARVLPASSGALGISPEPNLRGLQLTLTRTTEGNRGLKSMTFDLEPLNGVLQPLSALRFRNDSGRRSVTLFSQGRLALLVGELSHQDVLEFQVDFESGGLLLQGRHLQAGEVVELGDYRLSIEGMAGPVIGVGNRVVGNLSLIELPLRVLKLSPTPSRRVTV